METSSEMLCLVWGTEIPEKCELKNLTFRGRLIDLAKCSPEKKNGKKKKKTHKKLREECK